MLLFETLRNLLSRSLLGEVAGDRTALRFLGFLGVSQLFSFGWFDGIVRASDCWDITVEGIAKCSVVFFDLLAD